MIIIVYFEQATRRLLKLRFDGMTYIYIYILLHLYVRIFVAGYLYIIAYPTCVRGEE